MFPDVPIGIIGLVLNIIMVNPKVLVQLSVFWLNTVHVCIYPATNSVEIKTGNLGSDSLI